MRSQIIDNFILTLVLKSIMPPHPNLSPSFLASMTKFRPALKSANGLSLDRLLKNTPALRGEGRGVFDQPQKNDFFNRLLKTRFSKRSAKTGEEKKFLND